MIRPLLEYCNIIWDPHQKFLQDRLRSVEKFALRMCLKSWRLSYDELVAKAEITPLETRRIHNKLLLMYKVLYKLCYFPDGIFTPSTFRRSARLNHSLSLIPYSSTTNRFLYSPVPNMISHWNSLPFDPATCTSFAHFKRLLLNCHF